MYYLTNQQLIMSCKQFLNPYFSKDLHFEYIFINEFEYIYEPDPSYHILQNKDLIALYAFDKMLFEHQKENYLR